MGDEAYQAGSGDGVLCGKGDLYPSIPEPSKVTILATLGYNVTTAWSCTDFLLNGPIPLTAFAFRSAKVKGMSACFFPNRRTPSTAPAVVTAVASTPSMCPVRTFAMATPIWQ